MLPRLSRLVDVPALLLAGLLSAAAALPALSTIAASRDFYFFDVTLTSSGAGLTRVSWDTGRGFNEADSSAQPLRVEPKPVRYRYMLPAGELNGLRLSPNDHDATLTLQGARIVDRWGRAVRTFDLPAGDVATRADTPALAIDLPLGTPLRLPITPRMLFQKGRIALWCFLLGSLLSLRPVSARVRRILRPLGTLLALHPRSGIALAAGLAVLVQAYPVAFLGRSFVSPANGGLMLYGELPTLPGGHQSIYADTMGSDVGAMLFQHLYYPMVERAALLDGELPLWNRYSLGGEPLLGQGQSMFGDPLNAFVILANGAAWAWDLRFLASHWLLAAGLGFGVWKLTRHPAASLIVAASAAHIGLYLFRLNHPAIFAMAYAAWIPWAWLGLIGAATDSRRQAPWLLTLFLFNGAVMTSGTVKEAIAAIACLNAAGILLVAMTPEARGRRRRLLAHAAATAGVLALSTAPLWLTFATTLQQSMTANDTPTANPFPLWRAIGLFDELFHRQGSAGEPVIGPALNFLFLVGFLCWLAFDPWKGRAGVALAAAAAIPFALAFGVVPRAVILQTPFLRSVEHVGDVFSGPLLVLIALLAGTGFARALGGPPPPWRRLALPLISAAALFAIFFLGLGSQPKSPFFLGYAASLVIATVGMASAIGSRQTDRFGLILIGSALALPTLLWRHGQYTQSAYNRYVFIPGERNDLHATSPAITLINQQMREPARVIGWDQNLFPSYNTALGWESIYGVDALRSPHFQQLAAALNLERVRNWEAGTPFADAPKLQRAHDLLNVRFSLGGASSDLSVIESTNVWPRAFFTDRVAPYDTPADFAAQVASSDGRPFAAIQRGTPDAPALPATLPGRIIQPATAYRLTANTTSFAIDTSTPGIAVLTETYYPDDFQVTLDGAPNKYFRVNHAFRAVFIPTPGHHEITFTYRPRYFTLSLVLSGVGLLGGMAFYLRLALRREVVRFGR